MDSIVEACGVRSFDGFWLDWYVESCALLVLAAWKGIEMVPTAFVPGLNDCVSLSLLGK